MIEESMYEFRGRVSGTWATVPAHARYLVGTVARVPETRGEFRTANTSLGRDANRESFENGKDGLGNHLPLKCLKNQHFVVRAALAAFGTGPRFPVFPTSYADCTSHCKRHRHPLR